MKIKNRRDAASLSELNGWLQMSDWFTELREDGHVWPSGEPDDGRHAEPDGDHHAEPAIHTGEPGGGRDAAGPSDHHAEPASIRYAEPGGDRHGAGASGRHAEPDGIRHAGPGGDRHAAGASGRHAEPASGRHAEPPGNPGSEAETAVVALPAKRRAASLKVTAGAEGSLWADGSRSAEITEPAAIGDQLRIPIAWCEMGSCISHHADPAALGEADIRARAISADWRVDALGRLACPRCQQSSPGFWVSHPVALWDRDSAIAGAFLMTAVVRNGGTQAYVPAARPPQRD